MFEKTLFSSDLNFISLISVPESHFKLNFHTTYDYMVQIKCSAFNVYPEPKLTLKYVWKASQENS